LAGLNIEGFCPTRMESTEERVKWNEDGFDNTTGSTRKWNS
jgi:hypothetical protein